MAATETKKKSPLSMTIGSRGKYPTKRSINLYYKENKTRKILLELAIFAVFLVALYFFTVYAVIAKLRQADEAEAAYNEMANRLQIIQEANAVYPEVRAEYSHYGNGYLNDEEKAMQDRVTMLNVINRRVHPEGGIQNITIDGNVATLLVEVPSAANLPGMIASLEESEYVYYVTAQTAGTVEKNYYNTYIVTENSEEQESQGIQFVQATITVEFRTEKELQDGIKAGTITSTPDADLDAGSAGTTSSFESFVPKVIPMPTVQKNSTEQSDTTMGENGASAAASSNAGSAAASTSGKKPTGGTSSASTSKSGNAGASSGTGSGTAASANSGNKAASGSGSASVSAGTSSSSGSPTGSSSPVTSSTGSVQTAAGGPGQYTTPVETRPASIDTPTGSGATQDLVINSLQGGSPVSGS